MSKNLIDDSKLWLPMFYSNGEWNTTNDIRLSGNKVDEKVVLFIGEFLHFLLESRFLNKHTVMWVKSNLSSVKKTVDFYNQQCDDIDKLVFNTVKSNIDYDKNKLRKYFQDTLLDDVLYYPDKFLDKAYDTLSMLVRKYCDDTEYKKALCINLPKEYVSNNIDERHWDKLVDNLKTFSKNNIRDIETGNSKIFTPDMIGYYNYLISSKSLNKEDKYRLEEIRRILGLT